MPVKDMSAKRMKVKETQDKELTTRCREVQKNTFNYLITVYFPLIIPLSDPASAS